MHIPPRFQDLGHKMANTYISMAQMQWLALAYLHLASLERLNIDQVARSWSPCPGWLLSCHCYPKISVSYHAKVEIQNALTIRSAMIDHISMGRTRATRRMSTNFIVSRCLKSVRCHSVSGYRGMKNEPAKKKGLLCKRGPLRWDRPSDESTHVIT